MTIKYKERLQGVHPSLVKILELTDHLLKDKTIVIIEGVRTQQQQQDRYDQGRTKPGRIVTNSLKSKHLRQIDGYGHAIDIAIQENGKIDWNNLDLFDLLRITMVEAARQLGIKNFRSGADWDKDNIPDYKEVQSYIKEFGHRPLVDYPHYELT